MAETGAARETGSDGASVKYQTFSLDFINNGGITYPTNPALHDLVVEWCKKNLAIFPDFTKHAKTFVAATCDDNGKIVSIEGITWAVNSIDFPGFRYLHPWAAKALIDRSRDWLEANGIPPGSKVMVHVDPNEAPEQKCEDPQRWLEYIKAQPANRWEFPLW